jgi:L-seryl-tRNA(Ser) seleniumtransferase
VAHPVFKTGGARQTALEGSTPSPFRMSDRDRLRDLPSVDGAILRAHPSNFRTVGFVAEVEIEELCDLGAAVIDDVGSGVLTDDLELLAGEPPVRRSVRAGAALTAFSGDKLLGGPQAGMLAMLDADDATLSRRAHELAAATGGAVVASTARVGGGALWLLELPGPAVAIDPGPAGANALAAGLRAGDPAVVGRIQDGRLLLDPRTLTDDEAREVARAVRAVSP